MGADRARPPHDTGYVLPGVCLTATIAGSVAMAAVYALLSVILVIVVVVVVLFLSAQGISDTEGEETRNLLRNDITLERPLAQLVS